MTKIRRGLWLLQSDYILNTKKELLKKVTPESYHQGAAAKDIHLYKQAKNEVDKVQQDKLDLKMTGDEAKRRFIQ